MIKTFFFSRNFSPPPSTLLLSASLAPSPIDHHTEEITLIAGITSPHVGYTQGGGGGHVRHDVQVCDEGGGPGNAKSGPLGKDPCSSAAPQTLLDLFNTLFKHYDNFF